jgi:hypothetical protein
VRDVFSFAIFDAWRQDVRQMAGSERDMLVSGMQRQIGLAAFFLSCAGCAMLTPTASGTVAAPAGTTVEVVFSCVEDSVRSLHQAQSLWDDRVTRRDGHTGTIETGDFEDDNVVGFRVRVRFALDAGEILVLIKGAGLYFTDLGVDEALAAFDSRMRVCLSR